MSLRRHFEYNYCHHCFQLIFRTAQPRVGQTDLRSVWKHAATKESACQPKHAYPSPQYENMRSLEGPGPRGYGPYERPRRKR